MIRKFNYTGRQRIPHTKVQIRLIPDEPRPPLFEAKLDFADLGLPSDGSVFIEAYDKSSYMRFSCGTVEFPVQQSDCHLSELQSRDGISFRVKVVDITAQHGKVLAIADRLPPVRLDEKEADKESILGVRYSDGLGDEVWRLDLSGNLPLLELNKDLEDLSLREIVRSDPLFISLVLPAVVRQIFAYIVDQGVDASGDDWKSLWLRYAAQIGAEPDIRWSDREEKEKWIDSAVVPAFCRKFKIKERFRQAKSGDN